MLRIDQKPHPGHMSGMCMSHQKFTINIAAVLTGRAKPLGRDDVSSAIAKIPRHERLTVSMTGFTEDEQADRKHHGGLEKAIHHYASDHYGFWRSQKGIDQNVLSMPGAFGENISSEGLTEDTVCIGDRWRMGTALLEVSQARQPCWKLNIRFGLPDMAEQVQRSGKTGWYYRVLSEGSVTAGDNMVLEERPCPEWTLTRLLRLLYHDPLNKQELTEAMTLSVLTENWTVIFANRLKTGYVEDWNKRLFGIMQNYP